jgi:predicted transglutaminase-like cysteine proteinase
MFGKLAMRGIAVWLLLLPPVCGGTSQAFAQYQINADGGALMQPPVPAFAVAEPFGLKTVPVTGGELLAKWDGVTGEIRADSDVLVRCRAQPSSCPAAAQKFLAVIAEGRAHEGRARVGLINRAINMAIAPMSDLAQWGVVDRWSAPLETLTTGRGDCEDYAIAKYVALVEAGVAADDVRLVIVRDLAFEQDHAVIAVRLDGTWIMLDNRRLVLVQDVDMPGVQPLFVLDDSGVKQFAPTDFASADARPVAAPGSVDF